MVQPREKLPLLRRTLLWCSALAATSVGIVLAAPAIGPAIALGGHTDSAVVYTVFIGRDAVRAPANTIRHARARTDGSASRLDLYLHWPDLAGYSEAARDDFNNAGGSRNILFLNFESRSMSRDMSGRLGPVYGALMAEGERAGPAGIVFRDLRADSGYTDEALAIGYRAGREPFVARCLTGPAAAASLAPCERDVAIGQDLSLTYRFPERLLADWQRLDDAVTAKGRELAGG